MIPSTVHLANDAISTVVVNITNQTITNTSTTAPILTAYQLSAIGQVGNHNGVILENWRTGGGSGSSYEVRATLTGGSSPTSGSDSLGSWLSLGSLRLWKCQENSDPGFRACQLLIEIRRASDGVVLTSATISLSTTVT